MTFGVPKPQFSAFSEEIMEIAKSVKLPCFHQNEDIFAKTRKGVKMTTKRYTFCFKTLLQIRRNDFFSAQTIKITKFHGI